MTAEDWPAPGSIGSDPVFHSAVMCAMHGNLAPLAALDGQRMRFAVRSISVLVAKRVLRAGPCELAGFVFVPVCGFITFTPDGTTRHDAVALTVARMVAVDATALAAGDLGDATHSMWIALWEAVPTSERRRLAFLLAKKFTTPPQPCRTNPGDPHAAQ